METKTNRIPIKFPLSNHQSDSNPNSNPNPPIFARKDTSLPTPNPQITQTQIPIKPLKEKPTKPLQFEPDFSQGDSSFRSIASSEDQNGSNSFSGVTHPPEPIDMDLIKTVFVPIDDKKTDLIKHAPFLEDLSIKSPILKPISLDESKDSIEKEILWDNSLPPSGNVSPHSSIDSASLIIGTGTGTSTFTATTTTTTTTTTGTRGDSLESGKTSLSRASDSSGLSDESNWSNMTGTGNKPHKGNDPRWKAISSVRNRDGNLGMSHFRLLKRLGCGDIGSVYLSELSSTRCYFAMKVMDKASLASRKKLNRAQTEREILQLLDHPFLPTLYTHFETERFSCLVMEFCNGGDLHTLRQRQPGKHFSEYAARFYAAEVLLAIEYLHMLGVVYRDLKPENVLVREDGHIMLSDFDLSLRCSVSPTLIRVSNNPSDSRPPSFCVQPTCAEPTSVCIQPSCLLPKKLFHSKSKKKMSGLSSSSSHSSGFSNGMTGVRPELVAEPTAARSMSFVGTHEYLAPEIIKGEGHGSAVDWWTFGIFLHELLYGKTPFKGSGNRATLFNVVGQQLRFPESPSTSYASRDLIRGLLVKEPQHRLGVKRGATEIKQHPFFEGVNWALIRCSTPPEIPRPVVDEVFVGRNGGGPAMPGGGPGLGEGIGIGIGIGIGGSKRVESKRVERAGGGGESGGGGGGKYLDFEFF
ncbi:hypothetical protein LUZ60_016848 [Juncus effusus]|nr:hypothetical protein LUZ60_016848 [Juncus effusus]